MPRAPEPVRAMPATDSGPRDQSWVFVRPHWTRGRTIVDRSHQRNPCSIQPPDGRRFWISGRGSSKWMEHLLHGSFQTGTHYTIFCLTFFQSCCDWVDPRWQINSAKNRLLNQRKAEWGYGLRYIKHYP